MKNDVTAKVPAVEEPKIKKERISKEDIPSAGRNKRNWNRVICDSPCNWQENDLRANCQNTIICQEARLSAGGDYLLRWSNDYLYCCPNNLEINVCCFMMDNIGYPKLEFGLSVMPFEDFSDCLAYTSFKVGIFCFGFINF